MGGGAGRVPAYLDYLRASDYRQHVESNVSLLDGRIAVTRMRQPAGVFPDPPVDCVIVQLLLEGTGPVTVDLGAGPWSGIARPGQVFVAGANVATDYRIGFAHRLVALSIDADLLGDLCEGAGTSMPGGHVGAIEDDTTVGLVDALVGVASGASRSGVVRSDRATTAMVASLCWALSRDASPRSRRPARPRLGRAAILAVRDRARSDPALASSVAAFAEHLGVDRFRLGRATRHLLGLSPSALLRRWQVEHALDLLEHDDRSLARVAATCGFSDQSHLTRVLKHELGATPGVLRRRLRQATDRASADERVDSAAGTVRTSLRS